MSISAQPDQLEREAKFRLRAPATFGELADLTHLDGYVLSAPIQREQTDTYLDTPAFDLLRAGYVVRVRQLKDERRLGLKSLLAQVDGPIQTRTDVEWAVDDAVDPHDADHWPAEMLHALPAHIILEHLQTIAVIRQVRQKRTVALPTATAFPIAEWSLDDVHVHSPEIDTPPLMGFQELEVEFLQDSDPAISEEERVATFTQLVSRVQGLAGLSALTSSKLERALPALVAGAHGVEATLSAEMDLAEACRLILHEQLVCLLLAEHGVRDGRDPEYVHEARVAIRRARAALRLLGAPLRPRVVSRHGRRLRKLGRVLGSVRDLDVALDNLRRFRKGLPKAERKALRTLRAALEAQRHQARGHLLEHLDSADHRKFIVEFAEFCATPGAGVRRTDRTTPEILPFQVRHTMPSIILNCFEQVRAYEVVVAEEVAPPPIETLHALRIQAKYLRYSLEFARPLLDEAGQSLIDQLKELQDHLGNLNDAHVEQERLHAWSEESPDHDAIRLRATAVDQTIADLSAGVPALLARFVAPENRARLGAALAQF